MREAGKSRHALSVAAKISACLLIDRFNPGRALTKARRGRHGDLGRRENQWREEWVDRAQLGQLNRSAADVYEEFFVPALFLEPARLMARAADIKPGQLVLDVACGTGVLARQIAQETSPGCVTGIDRNEGMLSVARRLAPEISWQNGLAETLPFADTVFDRVVSQFGLMFFDDPTKALREMRRVVKTDGRVVVAVWGPLESTPGYAAMVNLLQRLFGTQVADALRAPFALGDPDLLRGMLADTGAGRATIETVDITAHFPSLEAWVQTDVKGWTLADMIDDGQYQTLLKAAREELGGFELSDGTVAFNSPAHIATLGGPS
jgi:SAM-dependent methyltransferase